LSLCASSLVFIQGHTQDSPYGLEHNQIRESLIGSQITHNTTHTGTHQFKTHKTICLPSLKFAFDDVE
jgi:hypothetical protein